MTRKSGSKVLPNKLTVAAKQKSNRFNLKIVILELKAMYSILSSDMDEETRADTERTLVNCRDKIDVIARFFSKSVSKHLASEHAENAQ